MGSIAIMKFKILGDSKPGQKALHGMEGAIGNFSKKFGAAGPLVQAGMMAAVAAVPALAATAVKGLYDIGAEFDEMSDTIRIGTGASGDALNGLIDDAKAIGAQVPAEFDKIGSVVSDVNTRTGLTGKTLQTFSSQILEAGRMLGQDIDIGKTTAAFNAFHIEGDDTVTAMDTLFRVSQSTGIGMNELSDTVAKASPALQNLGFSFDESAALAGTLDKSGLDTSKTLGSMSRALVTLAKDGEKPPEAFKRVTGEIGNLLEKGDQAGALDLASKLFGTKGAPQFVKAIQDGSLNMDTLAQTAEGSGDSILDLGKETMDAAESWQLLKNNAKLALEPLGSAVFSAVGDALGKLVEIIQNFDLSSFTSAFSGGTFETIKTSISGVIAAFANFGQQIWPLLQALAQHFAPVFQGMLSIVSTVFETIWHVIQGVLDVIGGIIQTFTGLVTGNWSQAWDGIKQIFSGVWEAIKGIITGALDLVKGYISTALEYVKAIWGNAWNAVSNALSGAWSGIRNAVSSGISSVVSFVRSLPSRALGALAGIGSRLYGAGRDLIQGFINGITNMAGRVWDSVTNIASNAVNKVKSFLGIASPSRVFTEIGRYTGLGLVKGLDSTRAAVTRSAENLMSIPAAQPMSITGAPAQGQQAAPVINITVNGALDPLSVARQISDILREQQYRMGTIKLGGAAA